MLRRLGLRSHSVWYLIVLLRKYYCFSLFWFCIWRLLTGSSLPKSCTWTITPKTVLGAKEQRALPRRGSLGFQKESKSPGGPRTTMSAQPDPAQRSSWAPAWPSVKVSLHLFGDQFLLAAEMSRGCKVISQIAAERPGFILMFSVEMRVFGKLGASSRLRPERDSAAGRLGNQSRLPGAPSPCPADTAQLASWPAVSTQTLAGSCVCKPTSSSHPGPRALFPPDRSL